MRASGSDGWNERMLDCSIDGWSLLRRCVVVFARSSALSIHRKYGGMYNCYWKTDNHCSGGTRLDGYHSGTERSGWLSVQSSLIGCVEGT